MLGAGYVYLVQSRQSPAVTQTELVLTGLVGIVTFLQILSIGLPADYRLVIMLVMLAGLINWRLGNDPLRAAIDRLRDVSRQPVVWLFGLVVLLYTNYQPTNVDRGMYHLSSIRWYERYQAVPGLGNLHGRLAFNSSFFVTSAAFGFTDVVGQTLVAVNGFMFLLFGVYVIRRVRAGGLKPELLALHIALMGLVLYYLIRQVSSPTPDMWGRYCRYSFFDLVR